MLREVCRFFGGNRPLDPATLYRGIRKGRYARKQNRHDVGFEPLRRVLNMRGSDFVLAVGWLLQAMNPVGPYPLIDICGPSETGKTITSKMLLGTVDPNLTQLRRP